MLYIPALIEVALHEPLHIRDACGARLSAEDLQINRRKMMVGIGIELSLKLRQRLWLDLSTRRVRIAQLIGDPVDSRIHGLQRAQHVVKRAVLHHEHHNMFETIQPGWHNAYSPA